MISPHIAFNELDAAAFRNAHRLLSPPPRLGGRRRPPSPPLILFVEDGHTVKVLRPGAPAAELCPPVAEYPWSGAWSLGRLRRAAKAPWAIAVEDDALERIFRRFEGEIAPHEDFVQQLLTVGRACRAEMGKGLHLDPDPFSAVPIPSYAALHKTMDALLPDDRSAGLFVFHREHREERVWSSLVVEKRHGEVVRLTTHAALGVAEPSYRLGAHKQLLAALEARVARPHVALFLSLDAWREVVTDAPGALARKVALGEALIDPAPPWIIALTGVGAMAGVAQEATRLFGRFVPQVVKDRARAVSPFAALGFDPIAMFTDLRKIWEGR